MTSICAWHFSHMSIDIKKLRSSTILVMLLKLAMRFTLKFTGHRFLLDVTPWSEHSASTSHKDDR